MALVSKSVMVEAKMDDLMQNLVAVVKALHAGQTVEQVGLGLLVKIQSLVEDVKAVPGEFAENLPGFIRAIELGATDIATALLGK